MIRLCTAIVLLCVPVIIGCTRSPTQATGGGGTETVALVITLPVSMRTGGTVVYNGETVAVSRDANSVTLDIPKKDTIATVLWINAKDTVVLAEKVSLAGGVLPKIILFIHGAAGRNAPADSMLRLHIIKEGIIVLPVPDSQMTISDTAGMNGICLSTTVDVRTVGSRFRNAAQPIIDCNYLLLDSLGLCGPLPDTDYGSRHPVDSVFVNSGSAGAAGLGGMARFFQPPSDSFGHFDWGRPPAGTIRTVVDPQDTTRAQTFCMETGNQLDGGGTTPARRGAYLFWANDAVYMTSQALQVFRAVVRWTFIRS
jgi:hypothetical protein